MKNKRDMGGKTRGCISHPLHDTEAWVWRWGKQPLVNPHLRACEVSGCLSAVFLRALSVKRGYVGK